MEDTGKITAIEPVLGDGNVVRGPFYCRLRQSRIEVRTLFERLGVSHDCRALYSRNSRRIQIPACRLYTFARIVEQREGEKRGRIPMSFA